MLVFFFDNYDLEIMMQSTWTFFSFKKQPPNSVIYETAAWTGVKWSALFFSQQNTFKNKFTWKMEIWSADKSQLL